MAAVQEKSSLIITSFIVVSTLFFLLFAAAPPYIAVYTKEAVIPIFNMQLYPTIMPLIIISCLPGIIKEAAKLLEGRHTIRLAVGITAFDLSSTALNSAALLKPIWNNSLHVQLNETVNLDNIKLLNSFWNFFGHVLLFVVLL